MSFLGIVSSIESALGAQAFTLGTVAFSDTEVPSELEWGGYQATETFRQAGGGKTVVLNGYYDHPLAWEGIFRGTTALQRAQTLDSMTRNGDIYEFTGGGISRNVVITAFQAMYTKKGTIIPYRIFCEVIPDDITTSSSTRSALMTLLGEDTTNALSTVTNLLSQVSSTASLVSASGSAYLGQITPLANLFGSGGSVSLLSAQLSGISTQAGALSSLTTNTELLSFQSLINSASSNNSELSTESNTELNSIAANSQGNLISNAASLISASSYSAVSSSSLLNSSYLNRISTNISTAIQ
ncbi:hypothetical protein [Acetobacter conturbans]|uniref:DNA circulation N-terminal domain-containing protein n=1 Tax=Acetobacter conturbans TaxID=1737472 RepID=A0ABX0JZM6_9PROT|nr:hypothetical protein [Acetobacter conturbans]NHN88859.1 hypothetical protein [Acetobacter conturbans]